MTHRAGLSLLTLVVLVLCSVTACGSDDPDASVRQAPPGLSPTAGTALTDEWARLAATLDAPTSNRDASPCHRGDPVCLDVVIAEMEARLDARPCAHTAPFAFTYLEMTRGVAAEAATFDNAATISLIDARFARQYFDAFDNWHAGRVDDVPAAWQMAFATADRQESSAALDLILGMNAHISRDLAYIVAELAEDASGLSDEPADYRRVNDVIAGVKSPMLSLAADRFDPNLFLLDTELPVAGAPDPVELITDWRSFSFDLGVRLAAAKSETERNAVIAEIERTSAAAAAVLIAAEGADGTQELAGAIAGQSPESSRFLDADARRAYCERNG